MIGARLGLVQTMEDESFWNLCIRVWMKIRVDKPLQRELFVTDGEGQKHWVYFRYEKFLEF